MKLIFHPKCKIDGLVWDINSQTSLEKNQQIEINANMEEEKVSKAPDEEALISANANPRRK